MIWACGNVDNGEGGGADGGLLEGSSPEQHTDGDTCMHS